MKIGLLTAALCASVSIRAFADYALEPGPKDMARESPCTAQCELGSLAADAVRACAGSDMAAVRSGSLVRDPGRGIVTEKALRDVFDENRALAVVQITPAELWELLEQGVSGVEVDPSTEHFTEAGKSFGGFLQVSGLSFEYDASAPEGERVLSVRDGEGHALSRDDRQTLYTLCAEDDVLRGEGRELGAGLADALTQYLADGNGFRPDEEPRIRVIGARETIFQGKLTPGFLLVASLFCIVCLAFFGRNLRRWRRGYDRDPDMKNNPYI